MRWLKHGARANGLLILCSVVLALVIGEVGFRFYLKSRVHQASVSSDELTQSPLLLIEPQSKYGYRLKPDTYREIKIPGQAGRTWRYTINTDGLRGEALRSPHSSRKRILFIGDSYTFGWGVEDHETYPEQVEALLRQSLDSLDVEAQVPGLQSGCWERPIGL